MKAIFNTMIVLCFVPLITVLSCKKTNDTTSTIITRANTGGPSLNQLFADLRYKPQNFNVTAGKYAILFGANGTLLRFYENSFKDANGNILTGGTVNLQLIEMYNPGDMICNRATTLSNGQLLQSGGEVMITATMNGQAVYANKYCIGFRQSTASTQRMQLFYGNTSNADSVTMWAISDTTKPENIANGTKTDSSLYIFQGYVFDSCSNFTSI